MKKNQTQNQTLNFSLIAKSIVQAFSSLFFAGNKDFERLKNFIA
jgi:hypothetical protein